MESACQGYHMLPNSKSDSTAGVIYILLGLCSETVTRSLLLFVIKIFETKPPPPPPPSTSQREFATMRFWNLLACSTAVLAALTPRDDDDSGLNLVFEGCSSKEVKVYKKAIVEAKECIDAIVQLRSGSDTAFDQDQFPHELEYRDRYFGSASDEDSELVTSKSSSLGPYIKSMSAD